MTSVDLPALGRPTIASWSGRLVVVLVLGGVEPLVLDMRPKRLEQVGDAFAMLGADRDRVAEPEAVGFEHARSRAARPSALLATTITGVVSTRSQRADLLVERSQRLRARRS